MTPFSARPPLIPDQPAGISRLPFPCPASPQHYPQCLSIHDFILPFRSSIAFSGKPVYLTNRFEILVNFFGLRRNQSGRDRDDIGAIGNTVLLFLSFKSRRSEIVPAQLGIKAVPNQRVAFVCRRPFSKHHSRIYIGPALAGRVREDRHSLRKKLQQAPSAALCAPRFL